VRIALFVTCLGDTLFPEAARACVDVLERLGHEVTFPAEQTCCGQMHLNSGYRDEAARLARRFARVFADEELIVAPSSSCVGTVRELYADLLGAPAPVADRVVELSELLIDRLGVEDVGATFAHRVAYHPTCHSLRVTHVGDAPLRLLRQVRGLELLELQDSTECCGFGGTFAVKNADVSAAMLSDKMNHVIATHAEVCTAGDSSCLMHLDGLIRRDGKKLRVLHVAELLEEATR